jgi:hypothetical protein
VLRVVDMRWNCGWRRKEDRLSWDWGLL